MDWLKKTFKGLFKRRSASKSPTAAGPSRSLGSQQQIPNTSTRPTDGAPQLPPVQTGNKPFDVTDKPLPPINPQKPDNHKEALEAIQGHNATHSDTTPVSAKAAGRSPLLQGPDEAGQMKRSESGSEPSLTAHSTRSGVSAVGKENVAVQKSSNADGTEPPRVDEQPAPASPAVQAPAISVTSAKSSNSATPKKLDTTSPINHIITQTREAKKSPEMGSIPRPSEHQKTDENVVTETAKDSSPSHKLEKPAEQPNGVAKDDHAFAEEKIVLSNEPPPIPTVTYAPGMTATSGPLEEFPEGGEFESDQDTN